MPEETISAEAMQKWNKFIKWNKAKGYAGRQELDHDENLRKRVFAEYNKENPADAVSYETVKPIQNEIQKYRQSALAAIQSGKGQYKGTPESFMSTISQTDGIFGQKTSQWEFPEAYMLNKNTGEKKKLGFAPKVNMIAALNSRK